MQYSRGMFIELENTICWICYSTNYLEVIKLLADYLLVLGGNTRAY